MTRNDHFSLDDAVTALTRGYEEESRLYQAVRRLTRSQTRVIDQDGDLLEFCDLLGQKEDILRIIGQIDRKIEPAREMVMEEPAHNWTGRERLGALLARVTEIIDEIRTLEGSNAARLQALADKGRRAGAARFAPSRASHCLVAARSA